MKTYLVSLALGLLVGVIYALFQVRSPAPPVIALVGLLGILLGEQIPPLVKQITRADPVSTSWLHHQVKPHVFGQLPSRNSPGDAPASNLSSPAQKDHRHV
jgi:XapX domain-containing protein